MINLIKYYSDKELLEELKKIEIIHDTNEKENSHIIQYLDKHDIKHFARKLDVGDYSAQLGKYTFEKDFVIERKRNIDEICGNLVGDDRKRFEREFLRAKAYNTKVYLIIENASWGDVCLQNYRSKLSVKSLKSSLFSWQAKYNISLFFCNQSEMPEIIYSILYYSVRSKLLGK